MQIATKFAFASDGKGGVTTRGEPEYVRMACEASLKRLDVDYIDLYYQHRVDQKVPIEITVRGPFFVIAGVSCYALSSYVSCP